MDLHVVLAHGAGTGPLRDQLEEHVRRGVRDGRLRPGAALPPTRALARELGVSRGVVVEAYAQLAAEGFLLARRGAGTTGPHGRRRTERVGRTPPMRRPPGGAAVLRLRPGRPTSRRSRARRGARARAGAPDPPDADLDYGDPRGGPALRGALASDSARARGVVAGPGDVVITTGVTQGSRWSGRALRERGARRVAVEDPGCAASAAGPRRRAGGRPVARRRRRARRRRALARAGVDAVALTPAHQFPTGVVLAPARRAALFGGRETGAVLVEDDYDAELPLRPRAGRRAAGRSRPTTSSTPARRARRWRRRCGWAGSSCRPGSSPTSPGKRRADHGARCWASSRWPTSSSRGALARHLRRTRRHHRERRDALVAALQARLPAVRVGGVAAGLHVVAWLPDGLDEAGLARAAADRGVAVHALHADCTVVAPRPGALLLGYARLPEPALRRAVALLAAASEDGGAASAVRRN